ncbi:MAG: phospholipase A [Colwellia sp.]|nr:phospholipase A [Colwellia sp.]
MYKIKKHLTLFTCLITMSLPSYASFEEVFKQCLFERIDVVDKTQTLQDIESYCEKQVLKEEVGNENSGALSRRLIKERKTAFNPYVITPHKMNYILPVLVTDGINTQAYKDAGNWSEELKDVEAKFQLSLKIPLTLGSILNKGDQLFFAFTIESWWQAYTNSLSSPFRETNYQPEFFYFTPISWHPFEGNSALRFGAEHQSNGRAQSQLLSRSWNRVYITYLYEKDNLALSFRPWYIISDGDKKTTAEVSAADNPDIADYMGHFELTVAYYLDKDYEFSIMTRRNFATSNGAIELGVTFPLWGKLRGYAQYFNGYGDSLIDYDYSQQHIGIGIALTNLL